MYPTMIKVFNGYALRELLPVPIHGYDPLLPATLHESTLLVGCDLKRNWKLKKIFNHDICCTKYKATNHILFLCLYMIPTKVKKKPAISTNRATTRIVKKESVLKRIIVDCICYT